MFMPAGYDQTYGVLPQSVKDATSHRSLAARKLATLIAGLYADSIAEDSTSLSELDVVCRASIYAVRGEFKSLRRLLTSWINSSERASVLYEALLQTYLFAGFPVALESLSVLHDVCTAHGYTRHAYRAEEYTPELYRQRGLELCSRVYGSVFEKLMQRFDDISPEMQSWMIVEGYGKTLSRPGLDEVSRECAIVCILAVLGRESQLYSHIRGAINLGATEEHMATCAHALMECSDRNAEAIFSETSQRITSER
jgi:alkylhydroperoxidase/carboxymuconolactone decarboxylase family protein YurZ